MKRIIAILLALTLTLCASGMAEEGMAELRDIRRAAEDAIAAIGNVPTPAPAIAPTPSPTPDATEYETLRSGSKGDQVVRLQTRLIQLGYLKGSADGIYGTKTGDAVSDFQKGAGLTPTGTADSDTQRALYAVDIPSIKTYGALKYSELKPGGALYEDSPVTFTGTVMQALTDDTYAETAGVYTVLRVATRGKCYDIIYVACFRDAEATPFNEGDEVVVWGTTRGLVAYTSVSGPIVSLPMVEAANVMKG